MPYLVQGMKGLTPCVLATEVYMGGVGENGRGKEITGHCDINGI